MQVSDLIQDCAIHVHDPANQEVSVAQWITLFRSASQDLRDSGWLRKQSDDTTTLIAANTYTYTVPSGFAYIQELRSEYTVNNTSVYNVIVPWNQWSIHLQNDVPVVFFNSFSSLEIGKHLMVVGQKRPTIYTTTGQTIDPGMEAFVRERACAYAFQFLAQGSSEFARWRQVLASQKWQSSEALLRRHPSEFRVRPGSVVVPGNE